MAWFIDSSGGFVVEATYEGGVLSTCEYVASGTLGVGCDNDAWSDLEEWGGWGKEDWSALYADRCGISAEASVGVEVPFVPSVQLGVSGDATVSTHFDLSLTLQPNGGLVLGDTIQIDWATHQTSTGALIIGLDAQLSIDWATHHIAQGGTILGVIADVDPQVSIDYQAEGGLVIAGAVIVSITKNFVATGGLTLGGESITLGGFHLDLEHTFQPNGGTVLGGTFVAALTVANFHAVISGGLVLDGEAPTIAKAQFEIITNGGLVIDSTALAAITTKNLTYTITTAVLILSGSSDTVSLGLSYPVDSESVPLVLDGVVSPDWLTVYAASGTLIIGVDAVLTLDWATHHVSAGGLIIGVDANAIYAMITLHHHYEISSGLIIGGEFDTVGGYHIDLEEAYSQPTGGAIIGGASIVVQTTAHFGAASEGGLILGGEALTAGGFHLDLEHTFQPSGGLIVEEQTTGAFSLGLSYTADVESPLVLGGEVSPDWLAIYTALGALIIGIDANAIYAIANRHYVVGPSGDEESTGGLAIGGSADTGFHLDLEHTFQPSSGVMLLGGIELIVTIVVVAEGGLVFAALAEVMEKMDVVATVSGGIIVSEGILKDPDWGVHYWAAYHPYHLGTPFMIRALQLDDLKPKLSEGVEEPDAINWIYIPGEIETDARKLGGVAELSVYWEPEPPPVVCNDGPYGVILTGHINLTGSACVQNLRTYFEYIVNSEDAPLILNSGITVQHIYWPDGGLRIVDPADLGWTCLEEFEWSGMTEEEWQFLNDGCPLTYPSTVHIPYIVGTGPTDVLTLNGQAEVVVTMPTVYEYTVSVGIADTFIVDGFAVFSVNRYVYIGGADGVGLVIENQAPGAITELFFTYIIDETEVGLLIVPGEGAFASLDLAYNPVDGIVLADPGAIVAYALNTFEHTPATGVADAFILNGTSPFSIAWVYIPGSDLSDVFVLNGRNQLIISDWAYMGGGDGVGLVIEDLDSALVTPIFTYAGGGDDVGLIIVPDPGAPAGMLHVVYVVSVDVGLNLTPAAIVYRSAYNYISGTGLSDLLNLTPRATAAVATRNFIVPPSTELGDSLMLNGRNYPVVSSWTYVGQDGGLIIVPDSGQTHYPPDAIIHYIYYGDVVLGLDPNALATSSAYVYVPGADLVGLRLLDPGALVEITTLHYTYPLTYEPGIDDRLVLNGRSPMTSSAYNYYGDDSSWLVINGDPGEFQTNSPSPWISPGTPPYYIWHWIYIPTGGLILEDPGAEIYRNIFIYVPGTEADNWLVLDGASLLTLHYVYLPVTEDLAPIGDPASLILGGEAELSHFLYAPTVSLIIDGDPGEFQFGYGVPPEFPSPFVPPGTQPYYILHWIYAPEGGLIITPDHSLSWVIPIGGGGLVLNGTTTPPQAEYNIEINPRSYYTDYYCVVEGEPFQSDLCYVLADCSNHCPMCDAVSGAHVPAVTLCNMAQEADGRLSRLYEENRIFERTVPIPNALLEQPRMGHPCGWEELVPPTGPSHFRRPVSIQ